jgi:hypothetical protein
MRMTIEISDELCRQLKRKAAEEGVAIRQVVESALRGYLGKQTKRLNGKQNGAGCYPEFGSTTTTPFLI